jgi:hypothetical protein
MADGDLSTSMSLREFLKGLGVVMRLPRRKRRRAAPQAESAAGAASEPRSYVLPLTVGALLLGIAAVAIQVWPAGSVPVPADFQGVWVSSDPRYTNRRLEITAETVHFRIDTAAILPGEHPIRRAVVDERGASRTVTILYDAPSGESQLRLRRAGEGIVIVTQPDVIWRRR